MSYYLVVNALGLTFQTLLPILAVLLAASVISGFFRAATQIDDPFLTLVGKLVALALLVALAGHTLGTDVVEFSSRVWGGKDFYY